MIVPISDPAALKNVILTPGAPNAPKFFPHHRKCFFLSRGGPSDMVYGPEAVWRSYFEVLVGFEHFF